MIIEFSNKSQITHSPVVKLFNVNVKKGRFMLSQFVKGSVIVFVCSMNSSAALATQRCEEEALAIGQGLTNALSSENYEAKIQKLSLTSVDDMVRYSVVIAGSMTIFTYRIILDNDSASACLPISVERGI
jgi:hypothetical protein